MTPSINAKLRRVALAAAATVTVGVGIAPAAHAQTLIPGVTGCDAPGGQQTTGALIGALLGGALGNSLGRHDRTAGTVAGAALGAGLGSYVGCSRQRAQVAEYGYERPAASRRADARYAQPAYAPVRSSYQDAGYDRGNAYGQPRYIQQDDRYEDYRAPARQVRHERRDNYE